ncbi:MAG TPA: DUF5808 domain-containing protein [Melioribacteraceae bacterium]|nr:DUF5808 domain-containing protein [Melioribacteraceae bacterium]
MKNCCFLIDLFYSITIILLTIFIVFNYLPNTTIAPIIVSIFIYLILTLAFNYSFNLKTNNKSKAEINLPKTNISEKEKNIYINLRSLYIKAAKILIAFLPIILVLNIYKLFIVFVFFMLFFISIVLIIKYHLLSEGYLNLTFINTLKHGLFYYNKEDKRAIVDKPFGAGSTINFASKQGRLVFYVLISIPLSIFIILTIIFVFVKKV